MPFYIFNMESKFSEIEANQDKFKELKAFYADMMLKLENAGELTEFSYLEIRDMTNRVIQNLAKNYESIKKGDWPYEWIGNEYSGRISGRGKNGGDYTKQHLL